ncbi:MAG: 16S rRNA (adenine(1518)-N(6)/adenine(1519)-N(6))-dimethyltransferase RsmA [Planctomycetota bacterium]
MSERDPFASFRARMDALGFRPSSGLGQNVLLAPSLHRFLADRAGPTPGDTVVEIGVGLGFLTRELAARAGAVLAVEIDGRLLQLAREDLAAAANVTWVHGDALSGPERSLHPAIAAAVPAAADGRVLVVANLPYSVSGPLLAELCALPQLPARCVLLVQKELAQRIAAPSGDAEYGGLAVQVQALYRARLVRDVGPQVFRPRPKVVSAVLELERRTDSPLAGRSGAERRNFGVFVRQLYQPRRKARRTTWPAAVAAAGHRPVAWAEALLAGRAEAAAPDRIASWWAMALAGAAGDGRA